MPRFLYSRAGHAGARQLDEIRGGKDRSQPRLYKLRKGPGQATTYLHDNGESMS